MKPSKKQIAITADLMGRTLHGLDELGIPYAVLIEGHDHVWTNCSQRHAIDFIREHIEYVDKLREEQIQERVDRLNIFPPTDDDNRR